MEAPLPARELALLWRSAVRTQEVREFPSKRVSSLFEIFSAQSTSSNLEMDKVIFFG